MRDIVNGVVYIQNDNAVHHNLKPRNGTEFLEILVIVNLPYSAILPFKATTGRSQIQLELRAGTEHRSSDSALLRDPYLSGPELVILHPGERRYVSPAGATWALS